MSNDFNVDDYDEDFSLIIQESRGLEETFFSYKYI